VDIVRDFDKEKNKQTGEKTVGIVIDGLKDKQKKIKKLICVYVDEDSTIIPTCSDMTFLEAKGLLFSGIECISALQFED